MYRRRNTSTGTISARNAPLGQQVEKTPELEIGFRSKKKKFAARTRTEGGKLNYLNKKKKVPTS